MAPPVLNNIVTRGLEANYGHGARVFGGGERMHVFVLYQNINLHRSRSHSTDTALITIAHHCLTMSRDFLNPYDSAR